MKQIRNLSDIILVTFFYYIFMNASIRRTEASRRIRFIVVVDGPDDSLGHAFIMLEDSQGKELTRGHYPNPGLTFDKSGMHRFFKPGSAGGTGEDLEYSTEFNHWALTGKVRKHRFVQRAWQINEDQFKAAISMIEASENQTYWAGNQCAIWAKNILYAARVVIPFAIQHNSMPRDLFRQLGGKY